MKASFSRKLNSNINRIYVFLKNNRYRWFHLHFLCTELASLLTLVFFIKNTYIQLIFKYNFLENEATHAIPLFLIFVLFSYNLPDLICTMNVHYIHLSIISNQYVSNIYAYIFNCNQLFVFNIIWIETEARSEARCDLSN